MNENSMDDPPICCADCLWWIRLNKKMRAFGLCKRFPPKKGGDKFDFPTMHREEWCGEWVARTDRHDPFEKEERRHASPRVSPAD